MPQEIWLAIDAASPPAFSTASSDTSSPGLITIDSSYRDNDLRPGLHIGEQANTDQCEVAYLCP